MKVTLIQRVLDNKSVSPPVGVRIDKEPTNEGLPSREVLERIMRDVILRTVTGNEFEKFKIYDNTAKNINRNISGTGYSAILYNYNGKDYWVICCEGELEKIPYQKNQDDYLEKRIEGDYLEKEIEVKIRPAA